MTKPMILGIMLLAFCRCVFAQDKASAECPKIRLEGPSGITRAIETFTVRIEPFPEQPGSKFDWTVTGGKLLKGKNQKRVEVEMPHSGAFLITVEVQGLPAGCPNTASESTHIDPAAKAVLIDHLDRRVIPSDANLFERVVEELRSRPNDQLVVFLNFPPRTSPEFVKRQEKLVTEVLTKGGISVDRITLNRFTNGDDFVQFWRVPPGASIPTCEGCEPPAKVEKKQECPTISVIGPAVVTLPGEVGKWTAKIDTTEKHDQLEFVWSAFYNSSESSAATSVPIHRGQGTLAVEIIQPQFQLSAVVEVKGLPAGCPDKASGTAPISHIFSNRGTTNDCPTISVLRPPGLTLVGEPAKFETEIPQGLLANLRFDWTVSVGTIESGQDTPEIVVRTSYEDLGKTIIAKVVVGGLQKECKNVAEAHAEVTAIFDPVLHDEYGNIPLRDQKGRLDYLLHELDKNPTHIGYLIIVYNEGTSKAAIEKRVKFVKDHIFGFRRFSKDRVVILSESGDDRTRIYRIPEDASSPCPSCKVH